MSILIENLSKKFVNFQALDNINLEIKTGSLVALVGPSGSGKSTLLRILAGLDLPDSGRVWIDGKDVTYLPIQKRDIGFVFQNYSLFNTMNVYDNIAFSLDIRAVNSSTSLKRVNQLLHLIRLEIFSKYYPYQLSGGQKQRIALARALAFNPKIFLLDEPFGALDGKIRKELRKWLCRFHEEVPLTTVFVTHDQQEALEVADEIVIFKKGRIEQTGNPKEIYDHPANSFVKQNNSKNFKNRLFL
uniref:Probable transport protein n=1 Tax=Neglectella solitaria TaxID=120749 RepID=C7BEI1_NEGSO|nr:probable transport protein [Neglectella solitaria]